MNNFTLIWDQSPQGSAEWLQARCGRLTGSVAAAVLPLKALRASAGRDNAKSRADLIARLAIEQVSGRPARGWEGKSDAIDFGINYEGAANAALAEATGFRIETVGFAYAAEAMVGVSLDGITERRGDGSVLAFLEAKCPNTMTHEGYRAEGVLPSTYLRQVLHSFWVTGADRCDFVSFNPDLPGRLRCWHLPIHRDFVAGMLELYIDGAQDVLRQVDAAVAALREQI